MCALIDTFIIRKIEGESAVAPKLATEKESVRKVKKKI